jgi:hypothetical protein
MRDKSAFLAAVVRIYSIATVDAGVKPIGIINSCLRYSKSLCGC